MLIRFITALSISIGASGFLINSIHAEVIQIPIASQAEDLKNADRPQRGSSKVNVLAQYGQALSSTNNVGEPPISRWEYQNFYVVFESDIVIHSVLKHRPKHLP
ncbi:MAG: phosphodiesterase [Pseudomonadales bacterium]|nr:phosphodiesterase [Pseudomonadales bacterium]